MHEVDKIKYLSVGRMMMMDGGEGHTTINTTNKVFCTHKHSLVKFFFGFWIE